MRRHSFVVTVAAGALALGACKQSSTYNPPPPDPVIEDPQPTPNPPAPILPTWADVASGHPEGATNPPIPHLVVKPEGNCFKLWLSPMIRSEPGKMGNYVDPDCVGEDCGVEIQCPDEAAALLADWKKAQGEGG